MSGRNPVRRVAEVLVALLAVLAMSRHALGQAAWEYSPYQVRVWIALEPVPQLPDELIPGLAESLAARSESVFGAVWQLEAAAAPPALQADLLHGLDSLTAERIAAVAKEGLSADKLYVASITAAPHGYNLAVREVDGRARQIGPVERASLPALESLSPTLWDLIVHSFIPIARVERIEEEQAVLRLRAGGLIVDPASSALIEKGMVLRPVLRRNDRAGEPAKTGGITAVPWTLIRVDERADARLACSLFSGYRGALPTRGSARTERLALLVKPRWESTRLVLQSRADHSKRLAGYDVYSRSPEETEPELIGATDSFGSLDLARRDGSVQLLFVKNGRQLLARLPIVPGQAPELTVQMADDEGRLQAEGFVVAFQGRALDLVARRQIIASRFRARLAEGKLAEAQELLDEFRRLETRLDLSRALDEAQQSVSASDRLTQTRIDKLLTDARKLLNVKELSDELLNQLTRELTAARTGAPAASKATGQ